MPPRKAARYNAAMAKNGLRRYLVNMAVTVSVVLLLQTGALIWFLATVEVRLSRAESDIVTLAKAVNVILSGSK